MGAGKEPSLLRCNARSGQQRSLCVPPPVPWTPARGSQGNREEFSPEARGQRRERAFVCPGSFPRSLSDTQEDNGHLSLLFLRVCRARGEGKRPGHSTQPGGSVRSSVGTLPRTDGRKRGQSSRKGEQAAGGNAGSVVSGVSAPPRPLGGGVGSGAWDPGERASRAGLPFGGVTPASLPAAPHPASGSSAGPFPPGEGRAAPEGPPTVGLPEDTGAELRATEAAPSVWGSNQVTTGFRVVFFRVNTCK